MSADLEELAERFEAELMAGNSPFIDKFVEAVRASQKLALLRELVDIELEVRCRRGDFAASNSVMIGDYLARFPIISDCENVLEALVVAEFRARQLFGDRPDMDPFVRFLASRSSSLRRLLSQVLNRLQPLLVKTYDDGRLCFSSPFDAPLEVGRQKKDELPFGVPTKIEARDHRRIVVAQQDETSVSRHHAYLNRTNRRRVAVFNTSSVRPIHVDTGELIIDCESSAAVSVPFSLRLGGSKIIRVETENPIP